MLTACKELLEPAQVRDPSWRPPTPRLTLQHHTPNCHCHFTLNILKPNLIHVSLRVDKSNNAKNIVSTVNMVAPCTQQHLRETVCKNNPPQQVESHLRNHINSSVVKGKLTKGWANFPASVDCTQLLGFGRISLEFSTFL